MIKRLQLKFIFLSMGCFLLVLSIIITAVNLINFNSVISEADELLELMTGNEGTFPQFKGEKPGRLPHGMSPEIPYETRFFSVTLDIDTEAVIQTDTSRIVSVDSSQALNYAKKILKSGKSKGFSGNFRFIVKDEGDALRMIFLDCGRKLDAFYNFLWTSIGISLLGYLIVFSLIVIFSNRFVRPVARSYEKQKRFITDAGHEIKTPLSVISANADVLELEYGNSEWLDDIKTQTRRLTELTNDLVCLSRMEEAENNIAMVDLPFSEIVSESASSFLHLAQTQNKGLNYAIQPLLTLHGNEKSIRQLIGILLDNALKYSPSGSSIDLMAEKHGKAIYLKVSNTSISPVDKQTLPLLFDRFYRADPSRNSQTGGYGIGLSIAKAITISHKGKIAASTDDGHSLTITITLPA